METVNRIIVKLFNAIAWIFVILVALSISWGVATFFVGVGMFGLKLVIMLVNFIGG
jgi:hypothetical protein